MNKAIHEFICGLQYTSLFCAQWFILALLVQLFWYREAIKEVNTKPMSQRHSSPDFHTINIAANYWYKFGGAVSLAIAAEIILTTIILVIWAAGAAICGDLK